MIDQILQDQKPENKPRFFLHDEVKLWLKDHLRITQSLTPNTEYDFELGNKLQTFSGFVRGIDSKVSIYIGDEMITESIQSLNIDAYTPFKRLSDYSELKTTQVIYLENRVKDLEKRIELLEKPSDV